MKNKGFPFPKKYWIYLIFCVVFGILYFVNIFVTDGITGDKELWNYTQQDWYYFALFISTEALFILLIAFFATKAGKLISKRQEQLIRYYEQFKFAEINHDDCEYLWFDFSGSMRARIVNPGNAYLLFVDSFDRKTESWNPFISASVFRTLFEIKYALFYEFDFFCEENSVLDPHGKEIFRDKA